jgi:hypothetical protein
MTLLGNPPDEREHRNAWLRRLDVIAAYRDQYQVITDDPRQVLGPYAEPGHAGHAAYWEAAKAVVAARTLAGLEAADSTSGPVAAQIAADIYLALPDRERDTISAAMAQRLGPAWLGDHGQADDHAATRRIYAAALTAVLRERRHLTPAPDRPSIGSDRLMEAMYVERRADRDAGLKIEFQRGRRSQRAGRAEDGEGAGRRLQRSPRNPQPQADPDLKVPIGQQQRTQDPRPML